MRNNEKRGRDEEKKDHGKEEEAKEDVMTEGKRNGKAKTERGTEKKIG
jgi:hypothetical protein